jgi:CMP-N-acetylneuraminic acid synthetase
MRVVGIVTARGGSQEIPRKNLCLLRGKPLLWYTAEAALAAHRLARVILSTEDEEIAEFGRSCGLDVPFLRPEELARHDTPSLPVVQHAVLWLESRGDSFDAVFLLQPTNPLRRPDDIDGAIELLEQTGADSVLALAEVRGCHPAKMKSIGPNGQVINPPFAESVEGQRRQDLPAFYVREGSVYLTRTRVLMEQNSFQGRDCRPWIIPEERACSIDTPFDLFLAERMLEYQWQLQ